MNQVSLAISEPAHSDCFPCDGAISVTSPEMENLAVLSTFIAHCASSSHFRDF